MLKLQSWCLAGTLTLFLYPSALFAQPSPVGGEFRVNTTTASSQEDPQIAMNANGDSVIVWSDGEYITPGLDGSSFAVVGQRYNSSGVAVGDEFIANTSTLGGQYEAAVAMAPDGNFVIVWTDEGNVGGAGDGSSSGIFGQRFDSLGNPIGSEFKVNNIIEGQQTRADINMDAEGNFLVAWGDDDGNDFGLSARLFDSSGTPKSGQFQVNTFTTGLQYRSDAGFDSNGDFVIAWRSTAPSGSFDYDIVARRFDRNGNPLTGEFVVSTTPQSYKYGVSLAAAADGAFIVAWQASGQDGSGEAIIGRRYDSAGAPIGGEFQINTFTTNNQENPEIAMDPQGNFTVVWSSRGQDGDDRGVFGQQFDSVANPVGSEFQVNTYTTGSQGFGIRGPDIAMDANGNFVVVWQDYDGFGSPGQDGDLAGVYAQRYGSNPPDPALVGHWPLDEGSGDVAANSINPALDGTLEGNTDWTIGQQASGALFDGMGDVIRVLDSGIDSPIDVTNALTIALWVRPDRIDGSTQVLVSKDNAYELEFGKTGDGIWDLRLNNQVASSSPTPLEEGVWQHLAVTWDGSTITHYYNGLADATDNFAVPLTPNNDDLGFGGRPKLSPDFEFEGVLDEIYVFNRELNETEIAQLVFDSLTDVHPPERSNLAPTTIEPAGTATVPLALNTNEDATCRFDPSAGTSYDEMANTFTLTGGTSHSSDVAVVDDQIYIFYVRCRDMAGNTNHTDELIVFGVGNSDLALGTVSTWDLNEGSGCMAADDTGGLNGTLGPDCPTNAPVWSVGHDGGGALTFDGNNHRVIVPNTPLLATPESFTLSAWIRASNHTGFGAIVDMRDANLDGYNLYILPDSKLFMRVNNKGLTGVANVADGAWHHVVGTYDGDTLRLYVDGVLDTSSSVGALSIHVEGPLNLGHHFTNTNAFSFAGHLSQAAIWERGLSAVEVFELYLSTR